MTDGKKSLMTNNHERSSRHSLGHPKKRIRSGWILENCEVFCEAKLLACLSVLRFHSAQRCQTGYKLFESDPDHPSHRFKKLSGTKDI